MMTREEAIAQLPELIQEFREWADMPGTSPISVFRASFDEWATLLAALLSPVGPEPDDSEIQFAPFHKRHPTQARVPVEPEKDLPDSEGFWWEWNGVWVPRWCEEHKPGGWYWEELKNDKHDGWLTCIPGRWVRCSPPPSQPGPSLDEAAIAAQRLANMNDPKHRHTVPSASPQADGGLGGERKDKLTEADPVGWYEALYADGDRCVLHWDGNRLWWYRREGGHCGRCAMYLHSDFRGPLIPAAELTTLRAEVERLRSQLSAAAIDCELQGGANG